MNTILKLEVTQVTEDHDLGENRSNGIIGVIGVLLDMGHAGERELFCLDLMDGDSH